MGLLNRAQGLDTDPESLGRRNLVSAAGTLVEKVRGKSNRVDYPREVFEAFKSILGFRKGALLFRDENRNEFYPWIAAGLDRTTTRRLRIPSNSRLIDSPGLRNNIDPAELAPLLSNREFGLLDHPFLISLGQSDYPTALLLVSKSDPLLRDSPEVEKALELLADGLFEGIERSRVMTAESAAETELSLDEWLANWEPDAALAIVVDLSNAIDAIVGAVKGLDLYRTRKDSIGLVKHVTGRVGRVLDLKDGRVLVMFPKERVPDPELYLQQLSQAFRAAYESLNTQPSFLAKTFEWPEEQESLNEFLSGLG